MPQRYVDAQYLRLLHRETVRRADAAAELAADTAADTAADGSADVRAECKSNGASHEYAHNCEADATTDVTAYATAHDRSSITSANDSSDVLTNPTAVDGGVHDCIRYAGGNVRKRTRRQLLRKRSHVRG